MKKIILSAFFLLAIFQFGFAQDDAAELAKKLANPIASLISVPFQNNTDYGIGSLKGSRNTMNIQPVVPISINKNINMITRIVVPVITQYNITAPGEKQAGLGDAVMSAFFSPTNSEKLTWGVGPALLLPVGTNDFLTTKKFGMGPTAVALKQMNGWTVGGLINQIWSVAGNAERPDVSQMFVQPFVNYNWKSGAGIGANMEWTQNWKASTSTLWLNPTISAVTSLGKQKTQFVVGPRLNLAAPEGGKADWGWRAVVIFLFPK
ncbi:hypothetical protein [Algoriphagus machipongonensis]|uniref:Transporter n=1 Tax=Algoriphagus machipongonensis TaxID=388413 RepID=A3HUP7_9BACT|nr:hypothetical protein [Algoriphagus machipongonensis]EAZ81869.1 hypothetical protein ALPR1_01470 [Algoriphagus machipongonensis]